MAESLMPYAMPAVARPSSRINALSRSVAMSSAMTAMTRPQLARSAFVEHGAVPCCRAEAKAVHTNEPMSLLRRLKNTTRPSEA